MTFINSIILLAALCCGVFVPMVVGHFLAIDEPGKTLYALGFAAASGILMVLYNKLAAKTPPGDPHAHH